MIERPFLESTEMRRVVRYYDSIAASYDQDMHSTPGSFWVRSAFRALITSTASPGSLILDFGCGTGLDSVWLAEHGYRVIAYDISPGMMLELRGRASDHIARKRIIPCEGDLDRFLTDLHYVDGIAAVVSNFAVMNLIARPEIIFEQVGPHVRAGGYVIVSVLNPLFWKDARRLTIWLASVRSVGRGTIHVKGAEVDHYRHWIRSIRRAAQRNFRLIGRASVGALIRRGRAPRDWNRPTTLAERIEAFAWRRFPMTHLGEFLFLVFQRSV